MALSMSRWCEMVSRMSYPSIDPNSAVTVVTLRLSTPVVAQYDAIATTLSQVTGRPTTRSDVIRMVLTPPPGRTVHDIHGANVSAALRRTVDAIAEALDAPPLHAPATVPVAPDTVIRARLEARIRELVSGLRHRAPISKLSKTLGRPRLDLLAAVLRDLEAAGVLRLLPARSFEQIKHSQRAAGIQDPERGSLLFVERSSSKPRFVGKPKRNGKPRPPGPKG